MSEKLSFRERCAECCSTFNWNIVLVGITIFLITFVPITAQIFIIWPWLGHKSTYTFLYATLPFDFLVVMIWINYYLACTTPPGSVPKSWYPSNNNTNSNSKSSKTKPTIPEKLKELGVKVRYCSNCQVYKPPRSHHCSICNRCILKMDHHCPWVNNCVGHRNLAHFVRFLLYTTTAVIYCVTLIGLRIFHLARFQSARADFSRPSMDLINLYVPPPDGAEVVFMILDLVFLFILLFTVAILTGYQIYYTLVNTTTIESFEQRRIDGYVEKGQMKDKDILSKYPYDCGFWINTCEVLGYRWYGWWIPQRTPGNGTEFPTKSNPKLNAVSSQQKKTDDSLPLIPPEWPPQEYLDIRAAEKGALRDRQRARQVFRSRYARRRQLRDDDGYAVSSDEESDEGERRDGDEVETDASGTESGTDESVDWEHVAQQEELKRQQEEIDSMPPSRKHVRRGSEGYIVREVDWSAREAMLKQYYGNPGMGNNGGEEDNDDNTPLGQLVPSALEDKKAISGEESEGLRQRKGEMTDDGATSSGSLDDNVTEQTGEKVENGETKSKKKKKKNKKNKNKNE